MSDKEMVDCTVHTCMHISSLNYDHYTNKDTRFPELEKMEMHKYCSMSSCTHSQTLTVIHAHTFY